MAGPELLLDSSIRMWVVLPIVFVTLFVGVIRHYVTQLLHSDKKVNLEQVSDRWVWEHTHTQRFVFSFFREPADLVIQLYCSISHVRVLLRLAEHPDHIYWNFHLFFFFSPLGSKRFWGFCCVVFHRGHGEPVSLLAGKYNHYISCRSTMCQDPDAAWPVLRSLVEGVTKNRGREGVHRYLLPRFYAVKKLG